MCANLRRSGGCIGYRLVDDFLKLSPGRTKDCGQRSFLLSSYSLLERQGLFQQLGRQRVHLFQVQSFPVLLALTFAIFSFLLLPESPACIRRSFSAIVLSYLPLGSIFHAAPGQVSVKSRRIASNIRSHLTAITGMRNLMDCKPFLIFWLDWMCHSNPSTDTVDSTNGPGWLRGNLLAKLDARPFSASNRRYRCFMFLDFTV